MAVRIRWSLSESNLKATPRLPVRIPILSRLTRIQRILLAVVAVIVIAFFFAVGCTNGGSSNAAEPPGFVKAIGNLFGAPAVARKDITAPVAPLRIRQARDTARYLGASIADLVNLLNPEVVVLSSWICPPTMSIRVSTSALLGGCLR